MKIYVDELPVCIDCPCECSGYCNITNKQVVDEKFDNTKPNDCPLKSLKDHDRAVKQHAYKKGYNDMRIQYELGEYDKEFKDHIYDLNNKLLNLQLFLKDLRDSFHKDDETYEEIDKKLKELEGEMISKERLEELIKQCATIFEVKSNKIKAIELKGRVESGYKWQYIKVYSNNSMNGKNHYLIRLFETKEEAEWYKEFGNITRTITLKLPTWGEFHKKTYYGEHYGVIFQGQETGCFYQMCEHLNPNSITIYNMDSHDIIFSMPQTEENYILACKKCRELFLGKGE